MRSKKIEQGLGRLAGKTVGILGLSFKPNTDDIRDAPALDIVHLLLKAGANVKGFDPQAMQAVQELLPELKLCKNPYDVAKDADAILLATEWNEFKSLDFKKIKETMHGTVIVDGRNIWDGDMLRDMGFIYFGIGVPNPK